MVTMSFMTKISLNKRKVQTIEYVFNVLKIENNYMLLIKPAHVW